jgi:hypothetical protein
VPANVDCRLLAVKIHQRRLNTTTRRDSGIRERSPVLNTIGPAADIPAISGRRSKESTLQRQDPIVPTSTDRRDLDLRQNATPFYPVPSVGSCRRSHWKPWPAHALLPAELCSASSRVAEMSPNSSSPDKNNSAKRRAKQKPPNTPDQNQQPGPRPAAMWRPQGPLRPPQPARVLAGGPSTPDDGAELHPAGARSHRRQHLDLPGGDPWGMGLRTVALCSALPEIK